MDTLTLGQYDYSLPGGLIAQEPLANRSDSRLLVVDRKTQSFQHRHIRDLPEFLQPQDCLVLNDTRVVPARLIGKRTQTGSDWEGLFLQHVPPNRWQIIGKTRKMKIGETVQLQSPDGRHKLLLEFAARNEDGTWVVQPLPDLSPDIFHPRHSNSAVTPVSFLPQQHKEQQEEDKNTSCPPPCEKQIDSLHLLDQIGWTPIPPYIRGGKPLPYDQDRYQTVYAARAGSVAAPTAGLHLTPELLTAIKQNGSTVASVTLHVGLGTFKPMTAENIEEHSMHSEWCSLPAESVSAIQQCRKDGGRIVAVGTTSVRVLESAPTPLQPFEGATSLFIRPPYCFRNVDMLLTNFHFPKSTLLILVRTFGGDELIQAAYQEAIWKEYRFFSYGDAMLIG